MKSFDSYSWFIRSTKYICAIGAFCIFGVGIATAGLHNKTPESTDSLFDEEFTNDQVIENLDVKTNVNGRQVEVKSSNGVFDYLEQRLHLQNGVEVNYDDNIKLQAEKVEIDLDEGTATVDSEVKGSAPFGQVQADGLEIKNNGETIHFEGNSSIIIEDSNAQNSKNE